MNKLSVCVCVHACVYFKCGKCTIFGFFGGCSFLNMAHARNVLCSIVGLNVRPSRM